MKHGVGGFVDGKVPIGCGRSWLRFWHTDNGTYRYDMIGRYRGERVVRYPYTTEDRFITVSKSFNTWAVDLFLKKMITIFHESDSFLNTNALSL